LKGWKVEEGEEEFLVPGFWFLVEEEECPRFQVSSFRFQVSKT
jgi:hypothetical protein